MYRIGQHQMYISRQSNHTLLPMADSMATEKYQSIDDWNRFYTELKIHNTLPQIEVQYDLYSCWLSWVSYAPSPQEKCAIGTTVCYVFRTVNCD